MLLINDGMHAPRNKHETIDIRIVICMRPPFLIYQNYATQYDTHQVEVIRRFIVYLLETANFNAH